MDFFIHLPWRSVHNVPCVWSVGLWSCLVRWRSPALSPVFSRLLLASLSASSRPRGTEERRLSNFCLIFYYTHTNLIKKHSLSWKMKCNVHNLDWWDNISSFFIHVFVWLSAQYLFGAFAGLIKVSAAVQWPLDQLVPASLDAEQQVFDEYNILLQAGKAKLRAGLLQSQDLLSVGVHFIHKYLGRHGWECRMC